MAALTLSAACTTVATQTPSATDLARLAGFALGLEAAGRSSGGVLVAHDGEVVIVLSNKDAPACHAAATLLHAQWKDAP
ncbi:hypothetical protein [Stenotrophomonas mori]|uniref:Heme-binding protein n=1 Tax=Stenotrophomonas mori TaxID=2871096 RepID=A0ABT0SJL1_9GAMM|nr:hypothetical protein [Stenotrophomonas mori]MCL7715288.1 hypothetical protein [Stenotrophomonas mori]